MTLSKREPSGGEAEGDDGVTPYKGSRCCVGFFQCQLCSHEWSSVYSWANSAQLCKPCSSKRRQTWVMPFRQIPKSRKYEFFCLECDEYIAESYRARDAHQGILCKKGCQNPVFPDWEFPCDACNIVHLYSFSKSEAMRGIDCECGAFLFPKHMKSLNKKHESRFCQKCQELGVNCCNYKAKPVSQGRTSQKGAAVKDTSLKKKPAPKGRGKQPRVSVSSVEADVAEKKPTQRKRAPKPRKPAVSTSSVEAEVVEKKASAPKRSAKPRKKMVSTSSVEAEALEGTKPPRRRQNRRPKASVFSVDAEISEEKKHAQRKPPRNRRPKASISSMDGDAVEGKQPASRKPPRNRRPKASVSSMEGNAVEGKKAPARKPAAPKGRKKSTEVTEEMVVETAAKPTQRGAHPATRGGRAPKPRAPHAHVYAEENVLRHAPTPKNSVATDPGIRERTTSKRAVKARQPRRPRVSGGAADSRSDKDDVVAEEVDALADKVAEAVIISAKRVVEKDEGEAPRQQKDENDNFVAEKEEGAVVAKTGDASASKTKVNVELKGGHPPALKVGGRRRVSSHRKSESEGKKAEAAAEVAVAEGEAAPAESAADAVNGEADPEKSQLQVTSKFTKVNHSEMTSVPLKPSPTKEVNRMAKVHPHHPTNKHPIQQPKKC